MSKAAFREDGGRQHPGAFLLAAPHPSPRICHVTLMPGCRAPIAQVLHQGMWRAQAFLDSPGTCRPHKDSHGLSPASGAGLILCIGGLLVTTEEGLGGALGSLLTVGPGPHPPSSPLQPQARRGGGAGLRAREKDQRPQAQQGCARAEAGPAGPRDSASAPTRLLDYRTRGHARRRAACWDL